MNNLDWNYVTSTDEFKRDYDLVLNNLVNSMGNYDILDTTSPFAGTIAFLSAIQRYFIRHLPDNKDIDLTPYIQLIREETGADIPATTVFPLVEFLRESKTWYSYKGTELIYTFIGDLVNAPIKITYPADLIFKLDDVRSYLDGEYTTTGPLPWDQSKAARLEDGTFWRMFTFVVTVTQAQNLTAYLDLVNLLKAVHPAGMKEYRNFAFTFKGEQSPATQEYINNSFLRMYTSTGGFGGAVHYFPSLDNRFYLDGYPLGAGPPATPAQGGLLDGSSTDNWTLRYDIKTIGPERLDSLFRRMWSDYYMHPAYWDPAFRDRAHSRFIGKLDGNGGGNGTGDNAYIEVFGDYGDYEDGSYDLIVYENVSTNVGIANYTYAFIKNMKYKELKWAAYNLEGRNERGLFMNDLLLTQISTSETPHNAWGPGFGYFGIGGPIDQFLDYTAPENVNNAGTPLQYGLIYMFDNSNSASATPWGVVMPTAVGHAGEYIVVDASYQDLLGSGVSDKDFTVYSQAGETLYQLGKTPVTSVVYPAGSPVTNQSATTSFTPYDSMLLISDGANWVMY